MQIAHHVVDSVDVIEVTGRAASLVEASELRSFVGDVLDDLADVGEPRIVLDLTRLSRADSGFIGAMLVCNERILGRGGTLKLVLAGVTREVFLIAGLDAIFEIYRRRPEAVKSFETQATDETKKDRSN